MTIDPFDDALEDVLQSTLSCMHQRIFVRDLSLKNASGVSVDLLKQVHVNPDVSCVIL